MPQPSDGSDSDEGMIDLETYRRRRAREQTQRDTSNDGSNAGSSNGSSNGSDDGEFRLPSVSDERLRELKDQARKMIEERLKARRRKRRLMKGRGGQLP